MAGIRGHRALSRPDSGRHRPPAVPGLQPADTPVPLAGAGAAGGADLDGQTVVCDSAPLPVVRPALPGSVGGGHAPAFFRPYLYSAHALSTRGSPGTTGADPPGR